jgi:hypothetical protein
MNIADVLSYFVPKLQVALGPKWKYYKSFRQFRRAEDWGFSYLILDVVTHNNINYHMAFRPMVRHLLVHEIISRLSGEPLQADHYTRTISAYTVNIGPTCHGWRCPMAGHWSFGEDKDLQSHENAIIAFLNEIVIPFIEEHSILDNVRHTLINTPGKSTDFKTWRVVAAIDCINNDFNALEEDYQKIKSMYCRYSKTDQNDIDTVFSAARQRGG